MKLIKILKRDIGTQARVSRNFNEGIMTKMKRAFWLAVYLAKAAKIGAAFMRKEQLGSSVTYKGRKCLVSNWAGSNYPTLAGDDFYEEHCDRLYIKNSRGPREWCHRFVVSVSWYTGSWLAIDVNSRLY